MGEDSAPLGVAVPHRLGNTLAKSFLLLACRRKFACRGSQQLEHNALPLKIPRRKNYILCFTFMDTIRGGAICLSPIVGTENYSFSPFDGYEDQ